MVALRRTWEAEITLINWKNLSFLSKGGTSGCSPRQISLQGDQQLRQAGTKANLGVHVLNNEGSGEMWPTMGTWARGWRREEKARLKMDRKV